jgi:hypothetical protein
MGSLFFRRCSEKDVGENRKTFASRKTPLIVYVPLQVVNRLNRLLTIVV